MAAKLTRVTQNKNRDKARGKAEWRGWAKEVRAQLDTLTLSKDVVLQLEHALLYRHAEHILIYLAFGDEIDLSTLPDKYSHKHFYATRTAPGGTLSVHKLKEKLEHHRYGFYQPDRESPEVALGRLELLLVPGLAFDTSGNRLGYGKGFYDRLLARASVPVVGVVPSQLIVPALPAEPHDVQMTHLLSEKGVLEVQQ